MTAPATTGLQTLAQELRSAASVLDSFAATLADRTRRLRWQGAAADRFRVDARQRVAALGRAVDIARTLAARVERLAEDAARAERRLRGDETDLEQTVLHQVDDLEALARSFHTSIGALLAADPALTRELVAEGQRYQTLQGELTTLGGR